MLESTSLPVARRLHRPWRATGTVVVEAMNGGGDTEAPLTPELVCFRPVQTPLAFVLAMRTPLGADGAFIAIVVTESLPLLRSVALLGRGRSKSRAA